MSGACWEYEADTVISVDSPGVATMRKNRFKAETEGLVGGAFDFWVEDSAYVAEGVELRTSEILIISRLQTARLFPISYLFALFDKTL